MSKLLAVCADDFGLSPAISNGIVQLVQAQRVTAVSCMTNTPYWEQAAPALQRLPTSVAVGLHINLTEGLPLSCELARVWPRLPTLAVLLARAHTGLIPLAAVQSEVEAQWWRFVEQTGTTPQHMDGHQHVHQLPRVREALFAAIDHLGVRPAMRSTASLIGPGCGFKRWVIRHTGAWQLQQQLQQRDLLHNTVLVGTHDFRGNDYQAWMCAWLATLPQTGGLLYCHPGQAKLIDGDDPIRSARQREFDYLSSDDFTHDLATADVTLVRAWQ